MKKKGVVSVWSNSPYQPTGYGVQAGHLVEGLLKDGYAVSAISNYGLEGNNSVLTTPYGDVPHYARGFDPYSNDVGPMNHQHWLSQNPGVKDLLITLYDVWVLKGEAWGRLNKIASWTPLDHVTMPPNVEAWLRKPNVTPIAMSPHGERQMTERGIENFYIPHSIDVKTMQPTFDVNGRETREFFGWKSDDYVVGMVAANKASGLVHRKAFSENLLAFANFKKKKADAKLYIHTDPLGAAGGWNLFKLLDSLGIPQEDVRFPSIVDFRYGMSQNILAAFMTTMDVMLAPSYGEGFGVPTVEAQACGTRVIGSSWAATPDLLADDCYMVEGQPQWDSGQDAWWQIPKVGSIVDALNRAYDTPRERSKTCIEFASAFDVDAVWKGYWRPFLATVFDA